MNTEHKIYASLALLVALGAGALRMVDGQLLVPDLKSNTFSRPSLAEVVSQLQVPKGAK